MSVCGKCGKAVVEAEIPNGGTVLLEGARAYRLTTEDGHRYAEAVAIAGVMVNHQVLCAGRPKPRPTRCRRGHRLMPGNIEWVWDGYRRCKTCRRATRLRLALRAARTHR